MVNIKIFGKVENRKMIINSIKIQNQRHCSKNTNKTNNEVLRDKHSNNVSFQRKDHWLLLSLLPIITIGYLMLKKPIDEMLKGNEKQIAPSKWDKNTTVFASQGQNAIGVQPWVSTSYSQQLINKLNKDCHSLTGAEDLLEKSGYPALGITKYPLRTQNDINIFNKNEKNKNRFVLTIAQDTLDGGWSFKKNCKNFSENIRKIYKIPKNNIMNVIMKDGTNFERNLDSMITKINKIKNKANVELLILYSGHGKAGAGDSHSEGALEGVILHDLNETRIKKIFKKKLKDIKKIIVIEACNAGAFVAKNNMPKKTLNMMKYFA